jgi:hypothetical protein
MKEDIRPVSNTMRREYRKWPQLTKLRETRRLTIEIDQLDELRRIIAEG